MRLLSLSSWFKKPRGLLRKIHKSYNEVNDLYAQAYREENDYEMEMYAFSLTILKNLIEEEYGK